MTRHLPNVLQLLLCTFNHERQVAVEHKQPQQKKSVHWQERTRFLLRTQREPVLVLRTRCTSSRRWCRAVPWGPGSLCALPGAPAEPSSYSRNPATPSCRSSGPTTGRATRIWNRAHACYIKEERDRALKHGVVVWTVAFRRHRLHSKYTGVLVKKSLKKKSLCCHFAALIPFPMTRELCCEHNHIIHSIMKCHLTRVQHGALQSTNITNKINNKIKQKDNVSIKYCFLCTVKNWQN